MNANRKESIACIVLAAGKGTRMRSRLSKVMHKIGGAPLIAHVLRAVAELSPERIVAVIAPGMADVRSAAKAASEHCLFSIQQEQKGTANAVHAACEHLRGFQGIVLVLYGDTPLITPSTLTRLIEQEADVVVLGMRPEDPTGYGRLVHTASGELQKIVEEKEASAAEKALTLCNSGVMAVRAPQLLALLEQVKPQATNGEYYLTDIVALARQANLSVRVAEGDAAELGGVNTRAQLAEAEAALQQRLRAAAMDDGATLVSPETIFLSFDTILDEDVVVQPHVIFAPGVRVARGAEIRSFSHLEGAVVGENAVVGPFARLRPGTVLEENVHIGNFVELKKTKAARGAKINHLSYVGDAHVGEAANIGAGTITCNYDGLAKHQTTIGAGAFIGSNTSLVAPVTVGKGAIVGAGSVITQDVPADALAVERSSQATKPGGALAWKEKKRKSDGL